VEDDPLSPSSLIRHQENWNGRLKAVAACGGKNRSQTESRLEERRFKPNPLWEGSGVRVREGFPVS
jgi:hypothetical protein